MIRSLSKSKTHFHWIQNVVTLCEYFLIVIKLFKHEILEDDNSVL